ncbi:hypothetical protein ACYJ1Y_16170 [Natrialbaceae archaeon A-gly3]
MNTHHVRSERENSTNGQLKDIDRDGPVPLESLGEAELQINLDAETYRYVRAEYENLVKHGYGESFATFAMNYLQTSDASVTVDGVLIDPTAPLEDDPDGGDSEKIIDLADVTGEAGPEVVDR